MFNKKYELQKAEKFHGHKVIQDDDLENVLGNDVLEITSNGDLVLRHYDEDGDEDDPLYLDPVYNTTNIMKGIRDQVGSKKFLISESAKKLIQKLER